MGINKEEYIKRYGKSARDPYSLSLSFIIERLVFCIDELDKSAEVEIKAERRGKKEDQKLLSQFNSTLREATGSFISSQFYILFPYVILAQAGTHPNSSLYFQALFELFLIIFAILYSYLYGKIVLITTRNL